jgi:membrane protease YdiL (CAAX protease family)
MSRASVFTVLTLAVSFFFAAALYFWGGVKWNTPAAQLAGVAYMYLPAAVAVGLYRFVYRQPVGAALGVRWRPNRWWLLAWLFPAGLAFATLAVSLLLPGVRYAPDLSGLFQRFQHMFPPETVEDMRRQMAAMPLHPLWIGLAQGLIAGATINALAAFGEEVGWRGFLLRETAALGFWRAALVIGLIWGIWHAPLILQGHNYPQHPVAGVFLMTAFCLLLSPLLCYLRLAGRSVLAAALAHGSLNGTAGLALMVVAGGNDLTVGVTGAAGLVVLAAANLLLWAHDRFGRGPRADELLADQTQ